MDKIVVSCLESRIDENQSVYSRFLLGPFLGGHAVTVATALRRALLSEVKNIAITALHIQGVTHEFSTVVGIRESVLELSLNFQQIILSTQTKTKNVQVGYLHVQGPAIVHANDLKLPDGIECVNPTQYIATLSSEGLLVVKFLIYDKKSFLKSKTSTLNSKKIKEAKAFSEQLSKSLLGHAEYDPSQLFRLLRNQSLPRLHSFAVQGAGQGVVECLLPPTVPHARLRAREAYGRQGEVLQALPLEDLQEEGHHLRAAPYQRFAANLRVENERTLTRAKHGLQIEDLQAKHGLQIEDLQATDSQSGGPGRHGQQRTDLEVPGIANQSRDLTTVGSDSNLDHSVSLLSDEFNSEVCLRTIIPLEPIFTPVYQVNFGIERDDLSNQIRERIIMEVWTNGSIHPRQAINEAVLSTMSIFSKLRKTFHLDSHALALSANSAASLTNRTVSGDGLVSSGFARARRLHKSKSTVKGGQLNDDESLHGRPLAWSRPSRPVPAADTVRYSPLRGEPLVRSGSLDFVDKKQELRLATNGSKSDRGLTLDRFTRKFKGQPNFTKLDLTNSVLPKLNSFSSLEFVRSRHPIALFLQSFGKSHIRGQTFLLEQSFCLKARFFKGHRAALSKAKYTSEDLTFKTTFLPSFKVVLGSYGANLQYAYKPYEFVLRTTFGLPNVVRRAKPEGCSASLSKQAIAKTNLLNPDRPNAAQDRGRLTKVQLLFRLRFCLSGAILRGTLSGSLCSTKDPLRLQIFDLQAAAKHEGLQTKGLQAQRSCAAVEQEPRNLLSPGCESVANQGRARGSAKLSKHPVSNLRFAANLHFGAGVQPTAVQGQQQIEDLQTQQAKRKPILFLIKYRTFSFTRNALQIFRRQQEASLFLLPLTKQLIRLKMVLVLNSCLPLMSKRAEPSLRFRTTETQAFTTVEGSDLFDGKQVLLALARSALDCSSIPCTQSNVGASDSSATETDSFVLADRWSGCTAKLGKPASSAALPAVSKRYPTCLEQLRCAAASGQFDKFIRGGTRVLTLAQSKTEQALPSPVGKLWLRKNLKKQFGFFKFACHGLRLPANQRFASEAMQGRVLATDSPCGEKRRRGSTISHSFFTDRAFLLTRLQRLTKSETRVAKLGSSGLCSASRSKNASNTSAERLRALTKPEVLLHSEAVQANRRFAIESPEDEFALAPRKRSLAPTPSQMLETRASRGPVPPSRTSCSPQLSQTEQKRDTFEFAKSTKLRSPLLSGVVFGAAVHWKKRWMVRLGVCVNRTEPLTNRRFVNGGSDTALASRAGAGIALSKKSNFTTFPLIMTKVPPLCLPSDLVTLISFPGEESRPGKIDCLTSTRYGSTKHSKSKARAVSKPCLGFARSLLLHKAEQDRDGGQQEQGGVSKTVGFVSQRSSSADLFGFNSGGTVLARAPLRLQIEDLQARRSAATPLTNQRFVQVDESSFQLTTQERLSILYGSNLDKISFLSSDLANLPLSLKTYTFLKKKGKKNIGSLLKCSPNALFSLLNGDEKMFHEIERCFLFLGLPFKDRF